MKIPDHELISCIGKGSYGEVWLARNVMGAFRAVKIVSKSSFKEAAPFERELRGIKQFEPISRAHDGLVDLLQIGKNEESGFFYYVMEVADDVETGADIDPSRYRPHTLAEELETKKRLPLERCIALATSLSQALAYLHSKGLVHRDIKPSNIIFVNGSPKLADVGLVISTVDARSFVGTPGFIPPEGPGAEQADVYSLGKVLYEMATGRDRKDFPSLPQSLEGLPDTQGFLELNEVIVKACQPDPARRYANAGQMADDLNLLASGASLRRLRLLERRWSRFRQIAPVAVAVLILIALFAFQFNLDRRRRLEIRERQIGSHLTAGSLLMNQGDLVGSLPHLVSAFELDRDPAHELTHRVRIGSVLASSPRLVQMIFASDQAMSVEFSADARFLMVSELFKKIRIFDVQTGQEIGKPFGSQSLNCATLSPDNLTVAAACQDGFAELWDIASRKKLFRLPHPAKVTSVRFNPGGNLLATACGDGILRIWDVTTGQKLREIPSTFKAIRFVTWSPNGRYVALTTGFGGIPGAAEIWDLQTGEAVGSKMVHDDKWIVSAAFSPDSQKLITAGHDSCARLWTIPSGVEISSVMHHANRVSAVAFSPDGNLAVTGSYDSTVRLWDVRTGMPLSENAILKNSSSVVSLSINFDGTLVAAGCSDGTVRIWELKPPGLPNQKRPGILSRKGASLAETNGETISVVALAHTNSKPIRIDVGAAISEFSLTEDGRYVLALLKPARPEDPKPLQIWDTRTGEPLKIEPPISVNSPLSSQNIAASKDFVAIGISNTVQFFGTGKGTALPPPSAKFKKAISHLSFSPRGLQLLVCEGNSVHLWDVPSGKEAFLPKSLKGEPSLADFSADGQKFATASSDMLLNQHPAEIWNAKTGERIGKALWHRDGVLGGEFSPDGLHFVSASEDYTAGIWDIATGRPSVPPLPHQERVLVAHYSNEGLWVATAGADKTLRVWNTASGEPISPWLRHNRNFQAISLTTNPPRLIAMDIANEVWEWTLPRDTHSLEDLPLLARLLASELDPEGEPGVAHIQKAWNELKSKYPGDFTLQKSSP